MDVAENKGLNYEPKNKKGGYNYVLAEVFYNKEYNIEKIKYYSIFECRFFEMPFGLYFEKYRHILPFKNAVLVESYHKTNSYFRARTHRDIGSFKKVGGPYGTEDFDSTQTEQETENGQFDGDGREGISARNARKAGKATSAKFRGANGDRIFQRQFARRYTKPTDSSDIVRHVRKAEKVTPQVFKGMFSKARNNLEPDVRWFVSIRKIGELKNFDCLRFNDESTNFPMGYVAVNHKTGDIGALLRDKACEVPQFTMQALANVILHGGNKLDCYTFPEKGLGYIYAKHGFMPVCRVRFDDSKAERAVRPNIGRPDIVMFFLIEVGNPRFFIDNYVQNVEQGLYPKYNEYRYVPYVDELPKWYQYGFENGMDEYELGLYIRDVMLKKWQTMREKYRGRECLFIQEQLK